MDTVKKKKVMIEQMVDSLGNISLSCKKAHIARQTHYNWMKTDTDYEQAIQDVEEASIDFAESKLKQQINKNNTTATIFYLKTKGRARGYTEEVHTVNRNVDLSNMTEAEVDRLLDKM